MSITNPHDKGDALEEAVRLIEETILQNSPVTKDAIITIEPKKIVIADNVKHEIDLFITIDLGKGYKSTFIFECKNWEEAVGKNEIIVFSEKIKVVQAQKGYFIARSFGTYAVAQAKKDERLELLIANNALDKIPPFLEDNRFHYLQDTILNTHIDFKCMTNDPQKVGRLNISDESSKVAHIVKTEKPAELRATFP